MEVVFVIQPPLIFLSDNHFFFPNAMLKPIVKCEFKLFSGIICGVTFVTIKSLPKKKLTPNGWKFNIQPKHGP